MMNFVKAHWISLACGAAAVAAIVILVLGMMSTQVEEKMEERKRAASRISSLRSDPQNESTIAAEKQRRQRFEEEYNRTLAVAERINQREPLLDGIFPKPAREELQYRFQTVYLNKVYQLPRALEAGGLPDQQDLQDEQERLQELQRRKALEEGADLEPGAPPTPPTPPRGGGVAPPGGGAMRPPGGGRTPPGAGGMRPGGGGGLRPPGTGGMRPPGGGGMRPPTGGLRPPAQGTPGRSFAAEIKQDEVLYRASVRKARSVRVYATPGVFHASPLIHMSGAPSPRDIWYAQVSLWIQEDIVDAIRKLNDDAAQDLAEEDVNVVHLPVKRIVDITVDGYVLGPGTIVPFPRTSVEQRSGQAGSAAREGPPDQSFTGSASGEQFDVVRFTLQVVVDQRDMLKLVDYVTRENFYQLIDARYEKLSSPDMEGYFYGHEPVVLATLDFEGFMARKVFKGMMPEAVLIDLGIVQAEEQ